MRSTFAAAGVQAAAPKPPRATQGTTVTLPVTASVEVANDQAVIELYVLEQSKDIAQATTKAIERAAEGLKQLKALYPQAELKNQTLTSTPRYSKAKEGEALKSLVGKCVSLFLPSSRMSSRLLRSCRAHRNTLPSVPSASS